MSNDEIADLFKWYANLSELHDGNPFKIKSYAAAAFKIDKLHTPLAGKSVAELEAMEGIGKSIAQKIFEINQIGSFTELVQLINETPQGIIDLFKVKGIGPKKIAYIWKQLGIESMGELLYACNENRLAQAKGFGLKTQQAVKESIEFIFSNANKFHFFKLQIPALKLLQELSQLPYVNRASFTGDLRRKTETLDHISLLAAANMEQLLQHLKKSYTVSCSENTIHFRSTEGYPVQLIVTNESNFDELLFNSTAAKPHLKELEKAGVNFKAGDEVAIYASAGFAFIEPEMREGIGELEKAKNNNLPELITYQHLKGVLHNHTTYSDGANTLAEMAIFCKEQGFEYLGICDHSKSAQYAGGLKEADILKQHAEIDALNRQLSPFKIYKGIESDILGDGALDYSPDVLASFDFVVASVHSNLKMSKEKAMSRLLKAIENPFTDILGHPSGRLLLMREGYPLDYHTLIDACAANGVAIELNANPYRLDLDWRYLDYALNKHVLISINPDAHETAGFFDMHFGINVARKGGLFAGMCLNAKSSTGFETWLQQRRK